MVAAKATRRRGKTGSSRRIPAATPAAVRAAKKAVDALASLNVRFALVGGQAVAARTEPRFTEDVDLAVAVAGDSEAQQLVFALTRRGWVMRSVIEQVKTGRLATVRLSPPEEKADVLVDLLFASSGVELEIVDGATPMRVLEVTSLPVASMGHLIAMKVLSESPRRLQDRIDLAKLVALADEAELKVAEQSLRLIAGRGVARKKNLLAILSRLRRTAGR